MEFLDKLRSMNILLRNWFPLVLYAFQLIRLKSLPQNFLAILNMLEIPKTAENPNAEGCGLTIKENLLMTSRPRKDIWKLSDIGNEGGNSRWFVNRLICCSTWNGPVKCGARLYSKTELVKKDSL